MWGPKHQEWPFHNLVFHFEIYDQDPFWIPSADQDSCSEDTENHTFSSHNQSRTNTPILTTMADLTASMAAENVALCYMIQVRERKGMFVEKEIDSICRKTEDIKKIMRKTNLINICKLN